MSELSIDQRRSGSLGHVSLALGLLAPAVFFIGTVAGVFWFVGAIVALAATATGVQALRRGTRKRGERTMAITGALIGAAIGAWFVVYLVVEAVQ